MFNKCYSKLYTYSFPLFTMAPVNKKREGRKYDRQNRFPRSFKEVARILKDVVVHKKNLRTSVYETRARDKVLLKKIYGLASSILTKKSCIDYVINSLNLLKKEPSISPEVIQILVHEIMKDHPLPGNSNSVVTIRNYKESIQKIYFEFQSSRNSQNLCPDIPRYARVHTVLTTVEDTIASLKKHGFNQINIDGVQFSRYLGIIQDLKKGEFVQDFHFKDVLVFHKNENLTDTQLYTNGCIFLQDKASYIPSFALQPTPGSIVLDCCAAPGMKTAHLACLMANSGKIHAFDRSFQRFAILNDILKRGHVKNCNTMCVDFTKIDPNSKPYSDVQYILLDPSCSGSGMVERLIIEDSQKDQNRIDRLARFQISMLKHAMSFPKVKKIVYSTCSIHEEENEYVVQEVLKEFSDVFEVVPTFSQWPFRGLSTYEFGNMCVRASPKESLTNGFFVAGFARISVT